MVRSGNRCRREISGMPGKRILALCRLHPIDDMPRQHQEPRTDSQVSFVGSLQVHIELKRALLGGKAQDPAGIEEFRSFSDGEYNMFAQGIQYPTVSLLLRMADEQNLASGQFLRLRIQRISTGRLWTVVPRVISARKVPKGNSPKTQTRNGAFSCGKASGGQSTKLGKFAR